MRFWFSRLEAAAWNAASVQTWRSPRLCKVSWHKHPRIARCDGGYTAKVTDVCVLIPTVHSERITPRAEMIVWHLWCRIPLLQLKATKWESIAPTR